MSFDLRSFIALLTQECQLSHIDVAVDPMLEIAAITDIICKQPDGGNALLFVKPLGSRFSVATNLFGSRRRCAMALGISELQELTNRMTLLLNQVSDCDFQQIHKQISALPDFSAFAPVPGDRLWNESQGKPDLSLFPFLQNWDGDGAHSGNGRYITLGTFFSTLPNGSSPNCGLYRAQIIARDKLAIRWNHASGAARHLEHYNAMKLPMPVALVLGGDPALLFSAMMPLPGDLDEITFAGFLRNSSQVLAECKTVPLKVPASAEVVIEGYITPDETFCEGPFGNHTGGYSPAGSAALMRIQQVSFRNKAIIPATVVGPPPMEDCWMQNIWERVLLALLQKLIPQIVEMHIPQAWSFHQSAIISLESPHPGMVRDILTRLWELPWFAQSRILIFVTADISPDHEAVVSWKCTNAINMNRDIIFDTTHTRIALDATGSTTPINSLLRNDTIISLLSRRWQEYGFD